MKNSPQQYDAVLASISKIPKNALVLGGKAGKKREFELLLQTDPEQAIQTKIGRQKLALILAKFNSVCYKEKSRSYPTTGIIGYIPLPLKLKIKFRKFPKDNNIRVYSRNPLQYAGHIEPQTLWELPRYSPNKCKKTLRSIVCKNLLLVEV